jgi:8-oxo-dGTP diphosphatase
MDRKDHMATPSRGCYAMIRRFGPSPQAGRIYRDRPGVYAVIRSGRDLLLAEQNGDLLLPGGGIEPGESVLQALHREIWEETGWRAQPIRRLGVFTRYAWLREEGYWCRKTAHIYLCHTVRRLGPPVEPDHTPVFMDARLAVQMLDQDGERVFAAMGTGQSVDALRLRGV